MQNFPAKMQKSEIENLDGKEEDIHFLCYQYLYHLINCKRDTTVDDWEYMQFLQYQNIYGVIDDRKNTKENITTDYVKNDTKFIHQKEEYKRFSDTENVRRNEKVKSITVTLEDDDKIEIETIATFLVYKKPLEN